MATRIVFLSGQETGVTDTENRVVKTLGRGHPNPAKLEGVGGVFLCVNWARITSPPAPRPVP